MLKKFRFLGLFIVVALWMAGCVGKERDLWADSGAPPGGSDDYEGADTDADE